MRQLKLFNSQLYLLPPPQLPGPMILLLPSQKKSVTLSASLVSASSSPSENLSYNTGKDGNTLPVFIRVVVVLQARLHSTQLSPLLRRHLLFRAGLISCASNLPSQPESAFSGVQIS